MMNGRCSDSGWHVVARSPGFSFPCEIARYFWFLDVLSISTGDAFVSSCNIWEHGGLFTAERAAEPGESGAASDAK